MKWPLEIDGWLIHDWTFDHAFQPGELFIFEEDLEAFRAGDRKLHVVDGANYAYVYFWDYELKAALAKRVERVHQVTRAPAK